MSKTILLIDDSRSLRQIVAISLRSAGFDVIEAGDGLEANGKLSEKKIDLIVCDVHMPNMDGPSFIKLIKAKAEYFSTPVIMLTTDRSARETYAGLPITGWMIKPFQPVQMINTVRRLIG